MYASGHVDRSYHESIFQAKGGWLGVLNNEKQLFSITRIANNVARVKTCLNKYLNCKRRNRKHVECQPARLKKDEQAVQDLVAVLEDFNSDPFDDAFPTLRSLQTGIVITSDILQDFNTALDDGKEQVKHLLEERIFNKEKALNATLKRNKRKNFSSISISGGNINTCHIRANGKIWFSSTIRVGRWNW